MDSVSILGLRVDRASSDEVLEKIRGYIAERRPRHLVTADASMAVIARRDTELCEIVRNADVVTPDGAGILWASRLLRSPIAHKVSGVDLVADLCRLSAEQGCRLFFLGAAPGVAQEAAEKLRSRFPGAQIVGTRDGYFSPAEEPQIISQIMAVRPDILLVAFGIPKQEKWITKHKAALGVPVSLGIGGSFDVYSGRVKRAPAWMQKASLEWLYRLCANPKKIGKVMTLPTFALLTLRQRFLGVA
jgi:N-acetylglucosaminyldiphosphoundecaprenol N-acetyl-beta-D-mannosaminyltransferase